MRRLAFGLALGAALLLAAACSGDSKPATPTPTPPTSATATPGPPAPRLNHCPETPGQEICDFAAKAEAWLQLADVARLTGGGPFDTEAKRAELAAAIDAQLPPPSAAPRKLRSIACPVVRKEGPEPDCSARFVLVFSTFGVEQARQSATGMLVLAYDRAPGGPRLSGYDAPDVDWQLALLAGPMTGGQEYPGKPVNGLGFRVYPVEVLAPGKPPSPPPGAPERIGGVEVRELAVGGEAGLPSDLVVYIAPAPWAADSFPVLLWRIYRDPAGAVRRDDLFANAKAQFGPLAIVSWAADERMGEIVFATCPEATCRGTGVGGWAGEFDLYRSIDGGITWGPFGHVPAITMPRAVSSEGTVMANFQGWSDDDRPLYSFFLHPSGAAVTPPAAFTMPRTVPGFGLVWEPVYKERRFTVEPSYDAAGTVIPFVQPGPNFQPRLARKTTDGSTYGAWSYVPDRPSDPHLPLVYFGRVDGGGNAVWLFTPGRVAEWNGPYFAGPDLLLGNAEVPVAAGSAAPFDVPAVLIDLATGIASPLRELNAGLEQFQQPLVRGAVTGRVARVNTGGDCLNVRESASAVSASLGCYRDGVLLFERGGSTVDGVAWVAIITPTGREGWASAEFLERRR